MTGKRHWDFEAEPQGKRVAALATSQQGVVSRAQLRQLGLSEYAIERDVREGRLRRVFRGVYAVGRTGVGDRGWMRAATLACGKGTVVSHRSAAALLGFVDRAPVVVDVIAPGNAGRKIARVRAHQVEPPPSHETGAVNGIPCTSPARTLVDIAGEVGARTLRSAFERAAAKQLLDVAAVEAAASRATRGVGAARTLAAEWKDAVPRGRLKSPLEAMLLPLLTSRGIAPPRTNAPVRLSGGHTIEVDFLWPEQRFVVEADSRDFHATPVAFERDRWRDRELLRAGYSTLRVTHQQVETEPQPIAEAVAAHLASAASRSSWTSASVNRRASPSARRLS